MSSQTTPCISGTWTNEFGSTLEVGEITTEGTFSGTYKSSTGATGIYPVVGVADPEPIDNNQTVSFSVTWRSLEGEPDPSWHWVSGFVGAITIENGVEVFKTTYLLQQNITESSPQYMATSTFPSTFTRA